MRKYIKFLKGDFTMRIIRIKARVKAKKKRKLPYENFVEFFDEFMSHGGLVEYIDYEKMGYASRKSACESYRNAIKRYRIPVELHYGDDNSLYLEKKSMYS
jgi:hypothetical protein